MKETLSGLAFRHHSSTTRIFPSPSRETFPPSRRGNVDARITIVSVRVTFKVSFTERGTSHLPLYFSTISLSAGKGALSRWPKQETSREPRFLVLFYYLWEEKEGEGNDENLFQVDCRVWIFLEERRMVNKRGYLLFFDYDDRFFLHGSSFFQSFHRRSPLILCSLVTSEGFRSFDNVAIYHGFSSWLCILSPVIRRLLFLSIVFTRTCLREYHWDLGLVE